MAAAARADRVLLTIRGSDGNGTNPKKMGAKSYDRFQDYYGQEGNSVRDIIANTSITQADITWDSNPMRGFIILGEAGEGRGGGGGAAAAPAPAAPARRRAAAAAAVPAARRAPRVAGVAAALRELPAPPNGPVEKYKSLYKWVELNNDKGVSGFEFKVYQGDVKGGQRHGTGTSFQYVDVRNPPEYVDKYTGEWRNGREHGQGKLFDKNYNTIYIGEFAYGNRHGQGTSFDSATSKKQYSGSWALGWRWGPQGTSYWPNGNKQYEGGWYKGLRHGFGTSYKENGSIDVAGAQWDRGVQMGAAAINEVFAGPSSNSETVALPMTPRNDFQRSATREPHHMCRIYPNATSITINTSLNLDALCLPNGLLNFRSLHSDVFGDSLKLPDSLTDLAIANLRNASALKLPAKLKTLQIINTDGIPSNLSLLPSLVFLRITGSDLRGVDWARVRFPASLEKVEFVNCQFPAAPTIDFRNLPKLRELNLSSNGIADFSNILVEGLSKLDSINLSGNSISEARTLYNLVAKVGKSFDLRNNKLADTSNIAALLAKVEFPGGNKQISVRLYGNPAVNKVEAVRHLGLSVEGRRRWLYLGYYA